MIDVHAHADALMAALAARLGSGVRVYDSGAGNKIDGGYETPVAPYAVVFTDAGVRSSVSVADGLDERAEFDVDVYSVGTSPRSARSVRSKVLDVVGAELTVAGRVVRVRSVFSDQIKPDNDDPRKALYEGRDGLTVDSLKA